MTLAPVKLSSCSVISRTTSTSFSERGVGDEEDGERAEERAEATLSMFDGDRTLCIDTVQSTVKVTSYFWCNTIHLCHYIHTHL